jgi:hypothetical protein
MKLNSDATDRRTHKLLVVAQLMTLAFFALGLAFALHPTAGNLFLFTTLSPVLVPGAVFILATQWIAAYQRGQTGRLVAQRAPRTYEGPMRYPSPG